MGTLLIKSKMLSRKSTLSTGCSRRDCSKCQSSNILSSGSGQQTEAWQMGVPSALSRSVRTSQEAYLMTETRGGTGISTSSLAIRRVQLTKCNVKAEAEAVSLSQGKLKLHHPCRVILSVGSTCTAQLKSQYPGGCNNEHELYSLSCLSLPGITTAASCGCALHQKQDFSLAQQVCPFSAALHSSA